MLEVFDASGAGRQRSKENCGRSMKGINSKLSGPRFDDVRHSFIAAMFTNGVALGIIQTFVGHLSNRMVRHYTHIATGEARRAVELLDQEPMLLPRAATLATMATAREHAN